MCSVCERIHCHPSCPNAPEPKSYGKCDMCGDNILYGDKVVEIEGGTFHLDCLSVTDVLELIEVPIKEAGDGFYD